MQDAEEQGKDDLEKLSGELEQQHTIDIDELNRDLERHKEAIGKLNDKLITTTKNLATARAQATTPTNNSKSSPEENLKL